MTMLDDKQRIEKETQDLQPKPCITVFDMLHVTMTLAMASGAALVIGKTFGALFGLLAFLMTIVVAFYVLGYIICTFVLFLYRRYSPQCRIGYEATCYVLSHFNR